MFEIIGMFACVYVIGLAILWCVMQLRDKRTGE